MTVTVERARRGSRSAPARGRRACAGSRPRRRSHQNHSTRAPGAQPPAVAARPARVARRRCCRRRGRPCTPSRSGRGCARRRASRRTAARSWPARSRSGRSRAARSPGPPARRSAASTASGVPAATAQLRPPTRTVVADAVTVREPREDRAAACRRSSLCTAGPATRASAAAGRAATAPSSRGAAIVTATVAHERPSRRRRLADIEHASARCRARASCGCRPRRSPGCRARSARAAARTAAGRRSCASLDTLKKLLAPGILKKPRAQRALKRSRVPS